MDKEITEGVKNVVPMGGGKKKSYPTPTNDVEPQKEKMMYLNMPTALTLLVKIYKYPELNDFTGLLVKTFLALDKEELKGIVLRLYGTTVEEIHTIPAYEDITKLFGVGLWL